jgi:hypothetical protein
MDDENETEIEQLEAELERMMNELDDDEIPEDLEIMGLGGLQLDRVWEELQQIDYERDPVEITIKPESPNPEDHHYHIEFTDLDIVEYGDELFELVPESRGDKLLHLAARLNELDMVNKVTDDIDSEKLQRSGTIVFEVRADEYGQLDRTRYTIPNEIGRTLTAYGAELHDATFYPNTEIDDDPMFVVTALIE